MRFLIMGTFLGVFLLGVLVWVPKHEFQVNCLNPVIQDESTPALQPQVDSLELKPVPQIRRHQVVTGENLSCIASRYGIDVDTIVGANPGVTERIYPGDLLEILPQKGTIYVVEAGDTVNSIAQKQGVQVPAILTANGKNDDRLIVGERLIIPGGQRLPEVSRSNTIRFIWPVVGEISSPFGMRWGRLHSGIDIAADAGTSVKASRSGRIVFAGWRGGYGKAVIIEHDQGYSTLYGHLSNYLVETGQVVVAGETIARVGSTGNSTGPHLHFEIRNQEQPMNPLSFMPN